MTAVLGLAWLLRDKGFLAGKGDGPTFPQQRQPRPQFPAVWNSAHGTYLAPAADKTEFVVSLWGLVGKGRQWNQKQQAGGSNKPPPSGLQVFIFVTPEK